jgi:hypothetical protein
MALKHMFCGWLERCHVMGEWDPFCAHEQTVRYLLATAPNQTRLHQIHLSNTTSLDALANVTHTVD